MNVIKSIDGVPFPYIPSSYNYELEDISASDAGRTEDTIMHKKRLRQVRAIELGFQNIHTDKASAILTAFQPEYMMIEYFEPLTNSYQTRKFYVGNRHAPLYSEVLGIISSLSFKIIEV